MKVQITAIGRLRAGPESDLVTDYLTRFSRSGRALGLGPATVVEVDDRKANGMAGEAAALRRHLSGMVVCLDERGVIESSPDFARRLARWRDAGEGTVSFVIGGADGIDPALRAQAGHVMSFGAMVWPHMLVRVMLAEQLYRAASILAGAPYHRA